MPLGTGKSLVALAWADAHPSSRVLILSDKTNATLTWPEQIYRHTDWGVSIREVGPTKATCANYAHVVSRIREYESVRWDYVVLDESSMVKDPSTRRFRTIRRLVDTIPNRICLNGVPMTERMEDLFGQVRVLDYGSSLTAFRRRYMQPDPRGYGWVPKRSALSQFKNDTADFCYWLDELPKGVHMPEQEYRLLECDMTDEQRRVDDELKELFATSLDSRHIEVDSAAVLFLKRLQLTGGVFRGVAEGEDETLLRAEDCATNRIPMVDRSDLTLCRSDWGMVSTPKLRLVKKVVEENPDSKIVVWHQYIPETELLKESLPSAYIYNGRDGRVLEGYNRCRQGVLLIRNSFARGLNALADTDISIFYSNPLSFACRSQAEGRSCRMSSSTGSTVYLDIVTRQGADRIVYNQLAGKKSMSLTLTSLKKALDI